MTLQDLLLETKTLSLFIDRWILFLWNNRKSLDESIESNGENARLRFDSEMRSKLQNHLKTNNSLIDELIITIEKIENTKIQKPTDFSKMNDTQFFAWTLTFFKWTIQSFELITHRYATSHFEDDIYGVPFDLLKDRISQVNDLYNFCRITLLAEVSDKRIFTLVGIKKGYLSIFTEDCTLSTDIVNNDRRGESTKFKGLTPDELMGENIIILDDC